MSLYPDAKQPDSFSEGIVFQDFVAMQMLKKRGVKIDFYKTKSEQYSIGESAQGYEVKLDKPCTRTGRLSIEIAEKTRASNHQFVPSGIYRKDNTRYYVQGNYIRIWIFSKSRLVELHKSDRASEHESHPTIRTFYLPIITANREALYTIDCKKP